MGIVTFTPESAIDMLLADLAFVVDIVYKFLFTGFS